MIKRIIIAILGLVLGIALLVYLTWGNTDFGTTFVFILFGFMWGTIARRYVRGEL